MAKKKKKPTRGDRLWQAQPNDAIRLAALRWFALEMERISIEIYASNQDAYGPLEKVFRHTLAQLAEFRKKMALGDGGECPDGFFLCKDGICAPMCDGIIGANDD